MRRPAIGCARNAAAPLQLLVVLVLAAATTVTVVAPAHAHDGAGANFDGSAGPYRVLAYDGVPASPGAEVEEYAVRLTNERTGTPVDAATVTATAHRRDRAGAVIEIGPVPADGVGNVYRYALPRAANTGWMVALQITGASGVGQVVFPIHGTPAVTAAVASDGGFESPPLLLAAGAGMLLAVAVTLLLLGLARLRGGGRRA